MDKNFTHLHVHSDYSLLDGAETVSAIVAKTAATGMQAIALTDHGVLYGAMEFYEACRKHHIKPIVGVEGYITLRGRKDRTQRDENHITLLAADEEGYRNLIQLVSKSFLEGFYYKPRIDFDILAQHQKGLICLSGCLSGLVQEPLQRGDYDTAKQAAQAYKDIFGDRFYLEVMRHGLTEQKNVETGMLRLHRELNVPLVATNDCHYLDRSDHDAHDAVLCISTGKKLSDTDRMKFTGDEFYLKTPSEMEQVFADLPDALSATGDIAARCNLEISNKGFHIPAFAIPAGKTNVQGKPITSNEYLRRLCRGGLRKRFGARADSDKELRTRLDYELGIIEKMGFVDYFLIVWDFIRYARESGIPVGPGRGSVVGSLVSYCLHITDLDPLKFGLLFERFLNPDRYSMPDIDTDFCVERRGDVIEYVRNKYGSDRVAQIATFGKVLARSAIRDAGRVLDLPLATVGQIATLAPSGPKGLSIKEAREKIKEIRAFEASDPRIRTLLNLAQKVEGLTRQVGTHAAGVVISDKPLTEYLPLVKMTDGTIDTQYDMHFVEELGLLKMDFLGLRNLTVMNECVRWITANVNPQFDLANIPDNDPETFKLFASAEMTGVFQMESDGMRRVLGEMQPSQLEDLIAIVALYRPGPMAWIPLYIDGKHGRRTPTYVHPALEPILAPTYGLPVFQEQVMQIAQAIAGFSMSEADELRKVMGKKIAEQMPVMKKKFLEGAAKQGVGSDVADAVFRFVEPFVGYGFNKCAHGSTVIQLPDGTSTTLSAAYKNPPSKIMSMWQDGEIRPHKVARIVRTGRKALLQIRTASGKSIKVTPEHRLLTTQGYMEARKMEVGTELITAPKRVTDKQRAARREMTVKRNQSAEHRARVSRRVTAYQAARDLEEKRQHMLRMHKMYPNLTRNGVAAMQERHKWLLANDPEWKARFITKSIASTRSCYDTGPGYGRCSIASNGMWCASQPERNMCEWLIEQQIPFEMHKVLDNGRICDFYFSGIYWEMDGMDRDSDYFFKKYNDLPYIVVTPEDFKAIVAQHLGIAHATNGDAVVSIDPCGKAMTYDVEMAADGPLNYIANRIVSHNSHAAAYAWISYQTAYLKAHYRVPYFCALLNSIRNDHDKVVEYLAACREMGLEVLPPDVNESQSDFTVAGERIRFGLSAVKGMGIAMVRGIISARDTGGPFVDFYNLAKRMRTAKVSKKTLETLVKVGACSSYGERGALLATLNDVTQKAGLDSAAEEAGQQSLLETLPALVPMLPEVPKTPLKTALRWEKDLLGFYVSGHPVDAARGALAARGASSLKTTAGLGDGARVLVGGLLSQMKRFLTKNGKPMLTGEIEDQTGRMRIVLFPQACEEYGQLFTLGNILLLNGRLKAQHNVKDLEAEPQLDLIIDHAEIVQDESLPIST